MEGKTYGAIVMLTLFKCFTLSEVIEAKLMGFVAAIFSVVVTVRVLCSHYIVSSFEAALGAASSIIVAALIITQLI